MGRVQHARASEAGTEWGPTELLSDFGAKGTCVKGLTEGRMLIEDRTEVPNAGST